MSKDPFWPTGMDHVGIYGSFSTISQGGSFRQIGPRVAQKLKCRANIVNLVNHHHDEIILVSFVLKLHISPLWHQ